ncbi:PP2C family protein-serine/threonine phosphatase [Streptomyces griseoaurantiacus]|uniref:PP2C family protein-serine/threonine phosphatase n=1 Tax=Streptomyces griseoaurantiacus TaxID=68213 RepID=UPI0036E1C9B4
MSSSTRTHAAAQLIGDRSHQCDATATYTHDGVRAYVLLDGIGSTPEIRDWTRTAARRLAHTAARHGNAETGLRDLYDRYADEPNRRNLWTDLPNACAVVAVHNAGTLSVAWCGDSRAYLHTGSGLDRLTEDHNMRRVAPCWGSRNQVTSWLGSHAGDDQLLREVGHPAIESLTRDLPDGGRLLLASDGAYEPLEDSCRNLATYLTGSPAAAARTFTRAAIDHASSHADNATVLIADLYSQKEHSDASHDRP